MVLSGEEGGKEVKGGDGDGDYKEQARCGRRGRRGRRGRPMRRWPRRGREDDGEGVEGMEGGEGGEGVELGGEGYETCESVSPDSRAAIAKLCEPFRSPMAVITAQLAS